MSIFDRTFLISTGVTAVICGAIYYYLNAKIRELEHALVKQNQVLSSFIANVQQEFRTMAMARANGGGAGGGGGNGMTFEIVSDSNELASPEALAAVAELDNRKIVITESVCDSSSEEDDDASEADASDSDSDSDGDEESEIQGNKLVIRDLPMNDMKIIDMSSLGITNLEIYTPERQSEDSASEADASEADASEGEDSASASEAEESDSEEDGFHRVTKLVIGDVDLNVSDLLNKTNKIEDIQINEVQINEVQINEVQIEELLAPTLVPAPVEVEATASLETPAPAPASKNTLKYDDLKVDELRKIVLEKGLAQKEEVKKLKKNELLALLKKHTLL